MLLSLILFLAKTSTPRINTLSIDNPGEGKKRKLISIDEKPLKQCPQLKIIQINMSVYFGSINHIQKRISSIIENEHIYNILIVGSGINFIDLAGAEALVSENNQLKQYGGGLFFVGLNASVYEFAANACFIKNIGNDHFFDTKGHAIHGLYKRLDRDICKQCNALVFTECTL